MEEIIIFQMIGEPITVPWCPDDEHTKTIVHLDEETAEKYIKKEG